MPRLRFQSKPYLYVVVSDINFHSVGRVRQVTYYGYDREVSRNEVIRRARENIVNKLSRSGGNIIDVRVGRVYKQ